MGRRFNRLACILAALVTIHALAFSSVADDYPNKPINFVYCYGPGGAGDIMLRAVAQGLEPLLGQPTVVLYKPGATGTIGIGFVAGTKPDGYTLALTPGSFAVTPYFQAVPYDIQKDFTFLGALGNFSEAILVRSDSPFKTLGNLVDYARQNPDQAKIAVQGMTSSQSIMVKFIGQKSGARWTMIPLSGGAESMASLLGGHIHAAIDTGAYVPHVKAGALRILAVNTRKRVDSFPDVPTLIECGYNFTTLTLIGIIGPKGLPEPIVQRLEEALVKARKTPMFLEAVKNTNLNPLQEIGKDYEKLVIDIHRNMAEYSKIK